VLRTVGNGVLGERISRHVFGILCRDFDVACRIAVLIASSFHQLAPAYCDLLAQCDESRPWSDALTWSGTCKEDLKKETFLWHGFWWWTPIQW